MIMPIMNRLRATRRANDSRRGMTLVELLVTMVVVGILCGALVRLMVHQSRFFDNQRMTRDARTVSRGALNLLMSELRMVEQPTGLVSVSSTALTARVPYAFGLLCGNSGGSGDLSLAPVDSVMFAEPGFSGFAWRDSTGAYQYVEAGISLSSGAAATCTGAGITTLSGGRVVRVTPPLPLTARTGTLVFLFRRTTYQFRASAAMPGRIALWRTLVSTGASEELIAPFDSTAGFRYFTTSDTVPAATPPASPAAARGVELRLHAQSERAALTKSAPSKVQRTTAVFFMNRR